VLSRLGLLSRPGTQSVAAYSKVAAAAARENAALDPLSDSSSLASRRSSSSKSSSRQQQRPKPAPLRFQDLLTDSDSEGEGGILGVGMDAHGGFFDEFGQYFPPRGEEHNMDGSEGPMAAGGGAGSVAAAGNPGYPDWELERGEEDFKTKLENTRAAQQNQARFQANGLRKSGQAGKTSRRGSQRQLIQSGKGSSKEPQASHSKPSRRSQKGRKKNSPNLTPGVMVWPFSAKVHQSSQGGFSSQHAGVPTSLSAARSQGLFSNSPAVHEGVLPVSSSMQRPVSMHEAKKIHSALAAALPPVRLGNSEINLGPRYSAF